jgi:thymidylate synthase (FAD)
MQATELRELQELSLPKTQVLDKGFIRLVDSMGDDNAIVQAARVSYGPGTKTTREDRQLIHYLMRHRHSTPFEMVQLKFHAKAPLFVVQQWLRHRTGTFNQMSARYSEMPDEFYEPDTLHRQSESNRQGRGDELPYGIKLYDEEGNFDQTWHPTVTIKVHDDATHVLYQRLIKAGVAKEEARMVLPANLYTEFYWSVNLHNFFHFHRLRADKHAQWEIQQYAEAAGELVRSIVPVAWEAYRKYQHNSVTFTNDELFQIQRLLNGEKTNMGGGNWSKGARKEFFDKLGIEDDTTGE